MAAWFTKEKYEGGPDSARCLELLVDAATLRGAPGGEGTFSIAADVSGIHPAARD